MHIRVVNLCAFWGSDHNKCALYFPLGCSSSRQNNIDALSPYLDATTLFISACTTVRIYWTVAHP